RRPWPAARTDGPGRCAETAAGAPGRTPTAAPDRPPSGRPCPGLGPVPTFSPRPLGRAPVLAAGIRFAYPAGDPDPLGPLRRHSNEYCTAAGRGAPPGPGGTTGPRPD